MCLLSKVIDKHPSSGTYFLRDVPLQPGRVRDVRVGVSFTVSILRVTQLEAVRGHDVLSKIKTHLLSPRSSQVPVTYKSLTSQSTSFLSRNAIKT